MNSTEAEKHSVEPWIFFKQGMMVIMLLCGRQIEGYINEKETTQHRKNQIGENRR